MCTNVSNVEWTHHPWRQWNNTTLWCNNKCHVSWYCCQSYFLLLHAWLKVMRCASNCMVDHYRTAVSFLRETHWSKKKVSNKIDILISKDRPHHVNRKNHKKEGVTGLINYPDPFFWLESLDIRCMLFNAKNQWENAPETP